MSWHHQEIAFRVRKINGFYQAIEDLYTEIWDIEEDMREEAQHQLWRGRFAAVAGLGYALFAFAVQAPFMIAMFRAFER